MRDLTVSSLSLYANFFLFLLEYAIYCYTLAWSRSLIHSIQIAQTVI